MAYDNKSFTKRIATHYSQNLHRRFPSAKFVLLDDEAANDLKNPPLRFTNDFAPWGFRFILDAYMRADSSLDEDKLAPAAADALSEALTKAAAEALKPDETAQLWIVHKIVALPVMNQPSPADFESSDNVGVFGEASYDTVILKNTFFTKAEWAIALSQ